MTQQEPYMTATNELKEGQMYRYSPDEPYQARSDLQHPVSRYCQALPVQEPSPEVTISLIAAHILLRALNPADLDDRVLVAAWELTEAIREAK